MLSVLFSSLRVLITDFSDLFDIQCSREIDLKINWSVKTPLDFHGHKGYSLLLVFSCRNRL